jgi:hypothetical protein
MKVELELPDLPDDWARGPFDYGYGVPPSGAVVLTERGRRHHNGSENIWVYAVHKWTPAIVTAGVLATGWVVIDKDGAWFCKSYPSYDSGMGWGSPTRKNRLHLRETPQVIGPKAIWKIL